jgi:polyhydroxyalkanoate synthase subunit PhaC
MPPDSPHPRTGDQVQTKAVPPLSPKPQRNAREGSFTASKRGPKEPASTRASAIRHDDADSLPTGPRAANPRRRATSSPERRAATRKTAPPANDDEVLARAVDAVGGAEDVGSLEWGALVRSLTGALMRSGRLTGEARSLAVEIAKILAGRSDVSPARSDWRFKDPAWHENPAYRRVAQGYLATTEALERISVSERLDWRTAERARMAVALLSSTLAPTNTLPGNPAAIKRTFDTGGANLVRGLRNFVHDVRHNGGMPSQVDKRSFEVGENLAATPGAVVYRDEICEVIQYQASTPNVRTRPVLMIPPQINRYYFMDLAPGRSFVEYAVSRGIQFFSISWRNPTRDQSGWDLDDYVSACLRAVDVAAEISGSDELATLGLCAGGITAAVMLSTMAARRDDRVTAATFGVTLLDFDVPAPLGMLQSKRLMRAARNESNKSGVLEGEALAKVFAWLRPNDLIWNYWVNNYLMGNDPPSFDILAWNSDSTRLSGALHAQFLDVFEQNVLCTPGALTVLGHPVDLGTITCDTYVTGAVSDHITPWQGCYRTTQLVSGKSTFVLSNAGHIASLVNPPGNPKARMFVGPEPGADAEQWRAAATERPGTWWEHWADWMVARAGGEKPASASLGARRHMPLEPAPGQYIRSR